jgi:hypothetical protein
MLRFASSPNPVFVRYALSSAKFVLGTDEDDVPVIVVSQISTYLDVGKAVVQRTRALALNLTLVLIRRFCRS